MPKNKLIQHIKIPFLFSVAENGGTSKSGVVANLSYLVTNNTTQTTKYIKAQKQGTKIISEVEFLAKIKDLSNRKSKKRLF